MALQHHRFDFHDVMVPPPTTPNGARRPVGFRPLQVNRKARPWGSLRGYNDLYRGWRDVASASLSI